MELLKRKADPPRGVEFLEPVHEYSHADGLSITGGFVYRGKKIPLCRDITFTATIHLEPYGD